LLNVRRVYCGLCAQAFMRELEEMEMSNIIYLPSRELLGHAITDVNAESDPDKRTALYVTLATRIREHSDETKRMMPNE